MIQAEARTVAQCVDEATALLLEAVNAKSDEEQQRLLARMLFLADAARVLARHDRAVSAPA